MLVANPYPQQSRMRVLVQDYLQYQQRGWEMDEEQGRKWWGSMLRQPQGAKNCDSNSSKFVTFQAPKLIPLSR